MNFGKCLISGIIGGVIGAAAWGAVAYFTGYEIGWLAWGVGVLVGMAVRVAAGGESGAGLGVLACMIALGSIAGGKYTAAYLSVQAEIKKVGTITISEDNARLYTASRLVHEYEDAGKTLKWPEG